MEALLLAKPHRGIGSVLLSLGAILYDLYFCERRLSIRMRRFFLSIIRRFDFFQVSSRDGLRILVTI